MALFWTQARRRKQKDKKKVQCPKPPLKERRTISIIYNVINRIIENLCNYNNTGDKILCHSLQIGVKTHVQLYTAVTLNSQGQTISFSAGKIFTQCFRWKEHATEWGVNVCKVRYLIIIRFFKKVPKI